MGNDVPHGLSDEQIKALQQLAAGAMTAA